MAQTPGLDLNYGAGPNLQLTLAAGLLWEDPFRPGSDFRLDGAELAAKIRFLAVGREERRTQLAVFPRAIVPDTDSWRSIRSGAVDTEWPLVWQQEFGPHARAYGDLHVTRLYGSGGRNPFFAGVAWERDANERWTLTGEFIWEGAEAEGERALASFGLGFVHALRRSPRDPEGGVDLLFACGRSFGAAPNFRVYVGPRFTFRSGRG